MNDFYICRHCKEMFHGKGPWEDKRFPCPDKDMHEEMGLKCCHWSEGKVTRPPTSALERKARRSARIV